ncbi:T6SS immunity protein Tli4 family protein [Viridibacterium curvum]|uniref:Tle cognate immunity protein 4 C-terminal domain-containing protein n=1 Tax=Viridibacterium curvum TaxID=1101404 RepID=A0ABP9QJ06_9RHOO
MKLQYAILISCALSLQIASAANQSSKSKPSECISYYTTNFAEPIEFPGARVQYMTASWHAMASFADEHYRNVLNEVYIWTQPDVTFDSRSADRVLISEEATADDLNEIIARLNKEINREKGLILDNAERLEADPKHEIDPDGSYRKELRARAAAIPLYQPIPSLQAFGLRDENYLTFFVLHHGHIINTRRVLMGTPTETVKAFIAHFKPRAAGEIPVGQGACLPNFLVHAPALITQSFRLKDRPEILVEFEAANASGEEPSNAERVIRSALQSTYLKPFNRIKYFSSIKVDNRKGEGFFYRVLPDRGLRQVTTKDADLKDMGYVAHIPGNNKASSGQSFDLTFKINYYSQLAKKPMSESDFKKLAQSIAESFRMRPNAWVAR